MTDDQFPVPSPSPNGSNGRRPDGKFAAGNAGGPGNPLARRTQKIRAALINAIKPRDIKKVVAALVAAAIGGDILAIKELLDRVVGKAAPADMLARIEELETRFAEQGGEHVS